MAIDLLQLGQHLGNLEARIAAIEQYLMGEQASAGVPTPTTATEEAEDIQIPGLGSMRALFEGQMKQHGGAEGLVARAFSMATQPPAAPASAPPPTAPPSAPTT